MKLQDIIKTAMPAMLAVVAILVSFATPATEPLDDLDRELFAPKKKSAVDQPGKTLTPQPSHAERPGDQIVRDLLRELRRADADDKNNTIPPDESTTSAAAPANPLINIARQMRAVQHRIVENDSGPATQQTQQQIIEQLDRLIEQAKEGCCGGGKPGQARCQGGSSERKKIAQSKKPSQGEKPGKGTSPGQSGGSAAVKEPAPPGRTDMQQMRALLKRLWGELPPRDREQMLQYPVEQFLPEYERMIEEYYKRLSEAKDD